MDASLRGQQLMAFMDVHHTRLFPQPKKSTGFLGSMASALFTDRDMEAKEKQVWDCVWACVCVCISVRRQMHAHVKHTLTHSTAHESTHTSTLPSSSPTYTHSFWRPT